MLVEAAGRLLGTLDLDAVLADVLRLAQSTLDADAYALWRRDPREQVWSLYASSGLSDDYVSAAPDAIAGNEDVAIDGPLVATDIASDGLAHARAQGGARGGGNAGDARRSAARPRRACRHARLLLAPAAVVRRVRAPRRERACHARRRSRRDRGGLRGTAAARRKPAPHRRGERATRVVARLRDDVVQRRRTRRARPRGLVRRRHRRAGWSDSAARRRSPGSGQGRAGEAADRTAADQARRRPRARRGDPHAAAAAHVGDPRRGARQALRRPAGAACRTTQSRPAQQHDGPARRAQASHRRDHAGRRRSRRRYGEADLAIALDLARRAATAVDNALLYREALIKESQVRFVAEAGGILSELLDYDDDARGDRATRGAADRGLVHRITRRPPEARSGSG